MYTCDKCGKEAKTKQALERHAAYHEDDRPYSCEVCLQRFKNTDDRGKHYRRLRRDGKFETACQICHKHFKDQDLLQKHQAMLGCMNKEQSGIEVLKGSNSKNLSDAEIVIKNEDNHELPLVLETVTCACKSCEVEFTNVDELKRHYVEVHNDTKRQVCRQCGASLSSKDSLTRHYSIFHQTNFPFQCEQCPQKFKVKESLCRHVKFVHKDCGYQCDICQRTFSQPVNLKKHMAVHSLQKDFSCLQCGRQFRWKQALIKHMLLHKNGGSQSMDICSSSKFSEVQNQNSDSKDFLGIKSDEDIVTESFDSDMGSGIKKQDFFQEVHGCDTDDREFIMNNYDVKEKFFESKTRNNVKKKNTLNVLESGMARQSVILKECEDLNRAFVGKTKRKSKPVDDKSLPNESKKAKLHEMFSAVGEDVTEVKLGSRQTKQSKQDRNNVELIVKTDESKRMNGEKKVSAADSECSVRQAGETEVIVEQDEAHRMGKSRKDEVEMTNNTTEDSKAGKESVAAEAENVKRVGDGNDPIGHLVGDSQEIHVIDWLLTSPEPEMSGSYDWEHSEGTAERKPGKDWQETSVASEDKVEEDLDESLSESDGDVIPVKPFSIQHMLVFPRKDSSKGESGKNVTAHQHDNSGENGIVALKEHMPVRTKINNPFIIPSKLKDSTLLTIENKEREVNESSNSSCSVDVGATRNASVPSASPCVPGKFSLVKHMLTLQEEEHFDRSLFRNPLYDDHPSHLKEFRRIAAMHRVSDTTDSNNVAHYDLSMKQNIPFQWLGLRIQKNIVNSNMKFGCNRSPVSSGSECSDAVGPGYNVGKPENSSPEVLNLSKDGSFKDNFWEKASAKTKLNIQGTEKPQVILDIIHRRKHAQHPKSEIEINNRENVSAIGNYNKDNHDYFQSGPSMTEWVAPENALNHMKPARRLGSMSLGEVCPTHNLSQNCPVTQTHRPVVAMVTESHLPSNRPFPPQTQSHEDSYLVEAENLFF